MKCSRRQIRNIIKQIISEQFKFPEHGWNSGFELYTEKDSGTNMKKKRKDGSGFLVGRVFPNGKVKFLGLEALPHIKRKKGGEYDIPKGKLQKGEDVLQGAKRECREESGIKISDSDIIGSGESINGLTIFLASTTMDPIISPNPDSGKTEHAGASWLSKSEIENNCLEYLKPIVKILTKRFIESLDKN